MNKILKWFGKISDIKVKNVGKEEIIFLLSLLESFLRWLPRVIFFLIFFKLMNQI